MQKSEKMKEVVCGYFLEQQVGGRNEIERQKTLD